MSGKVRNPIVEDEWWTVSGVLEATQAGCHPKLGLGCWPQVGTGLVSGLL
ncbi:MAG: hypothetical protein HRU74_10220 [Chthonomonadaceae bacterium]|nr:MAG: hypothetical protein HRU74_10220 [Chthonomonadaceae bacterium]